jgi:CHAT domain-containing protein
MKYCQAKRTGRRRQRALVFGDSRNDLFFAREEALAIAERFGTQAYLDGAATRAQLNDRLATEKETLDVLHFACHGHFEPYQPLKSRIELAKNGADDSVTAEEIFGLELHADLVVLSACESGANERRPGDELIGFTRALIYAGTPSVLVTLWQVDDLSSLMLMDKFYAELAQGLNKAQALQQAQLALMRFERDEIVAYIETRRAQLKQAGQTERARRFSERAFESVAAAESYNPADPGEATWHPFSHLAAWAPFILVGDWK